ncbi:MAG: hypothetical protein PHI29_12790 [Gallionella sp.]|nr:hypothetical protein [Gallionella sp.]
MTPTSKKASASDQSTPVSLADTLITLHDDFAEFCNISAFMCHGFASAIEKPEWLNAEIVSGARICSNWLQGRCVQLKDEIRQVNTRYLAESDQTEQNRKAKSKSQKLGKQNRNKESRHV